MVPYIPPELTDRVIDYLHDDFKSLAACALTSRSWLPAARYHRFRHSDVPWVKTDSFEQLLNASPDLGLCIESLSISSAHSRSTVWLSEPCNFLKALPVVSELQLSCMCIVVTVHAALVAQLPSVRRLVLDSCTFSVFAEVVALVASFPLLESLTVSRVEFDCGPKIRSPRPPPGLRAVTASKMAVAARDLFYWLIDDGHDTSINEISFDFSQSLDFTPLNMYISPIGRGLQHLHLHVEGLRGLFAMSGGECGFTLSPYVGLRTFNLRLYLGELCVSENQDISSVTVLIAGLNSPCLEELTLALRVDEIDMADLRALDSECGVRELYPARFDDLRALDWESMERTTAGECFGKMRRLVLEGRGESGVLAAHIAERCPDLSRREIISFVHVK